MEICAVVMPDHFLKEVIGPLQAHLPDAIEPLGLPSTEPDEATREALRTASYLVFTGIHLTRDVLSDCRRLRLAQKWGAGVDGIDLHAASELGIWVANVPGGNAVSVAEHVMGLLLAFSKRLCSADRLMRAGGWPQAELVSGGIEEIYGKQMGLVGLGSIGREIVPRARAFGLDICYFKPHRLSAHEEANLGVKYLPLEELLEQSDCVALVLPLTTESAGLFGQDCFSRMRRSAVLINTSRGGLVRESDLISALKRGLIAGAALDVFENEPQVSEELLTFPNVIFTPHIGGRTVEAIRRITVECALNVARVARGEPPFHRVHE